MVTQPIETMTYIEGPTVTIVPQIRWEKKTIKLSKLIALARVYNEQK